MWEHKGGSGPSTPWTIADVSAEGVTKRISMSSGGRAHDLTRDSSEPANRSNPLDD